MVRTKRIYAYRFVSTSLGKLGRRVIAEMDSREEAA